MIKPSLVCLDIWGVLAFSTMPKSSCLNFRWTRCLHICLRRAETSTSLRFTLTNELLHTLLERLHVLFRRDLVHFTCFHFTGWNEKSKTIGRVPRCQREHYIYNFSPKNKSQCRKTLRPLSLTCVVWPHWNHLHRYTLYTPSVNHQKDIAKNVCSQNYHFSTDLLDKCLRP